MYGLDGDGWSPMAQDTAKGETWRRIGASADIRVYPIADTLELRLRVDQPPGRYASVRAGDIVLSVAPPRETVDLSVLIPPDVLARAGNVLTLETRGAPRDGLRVREVAMRVSPVDTATSDRSR